MSANESRVPASAIALISSLESRLVMTKLIIGAVIGLCVGALVGGLAFGALSSETTATAFLRLQNPADLTAIAGGADQITPDNQANTATFVAGEIAYMTGEGFSQAVARKMAMDEPAELAVAQASESPVVTVSYSSASRDDAIRTVQAAIDLYRQELEQRVDAQLRVILPTLAQWQRSDAADPTRTQELQRVRESVELQAAEASTLLVMQPPTPNHPSSGQWLIGAILGALVGSACAVAFLLARRRRSGRGSVVKTLTGSVDSVLLPAVDLDLPPRDAWTDEQVRLARTLYAQCPSTGPGGVILVLGASSSSGASVVVSLLESAAAESRPAAAPNSSGHHAASRESPTTQVVDGGVVGDTSLSSDMVAGATAIVLVARIEVDTVAQVVTLRSATAASAAPVVAVFTHRRGLSGRLRKRRHAGSPL
ncbi:hypothetical protein [Mycolicibacterium pyrenivorans]|uniref:hypothetical protein n=1 Tax=Mycolicibacterium pyrenivorans TaxID=187102 RepID=UPI0021F329A2|nr:hypothetical protein [Mycolicibacterium pyrenivorans]MCV7154019.1 hypothetical protein [Mycolicibacterium pyrenivorans]